MLSHFDQSPGAGTTRLVIGISASRRFRGLQQRWLASRTREACRVLGVGSGEISIRLADDGEMSRLHLQHKGVAGPTDVLTFDFEAPADSDRVHVEVEIIVGAEVALREAVKRDHPPAVEALLYITHGLLHCLGHDDHDPKRAAAMHRREDQVLNSLGVGPAYHTGNQRRSR